MFLIKSEREHFAEELCMLTHFTWIAPVCLKYIICTGHWFQKSTHSTLLIYKKNITLISAVWSRAEDKTGNKNTHLFNSRSSMKIRCFSRAVALSLGKLSRCSFHGISDGVAKVSTSVEKIVLKSRLTGNPNGLASGVAIAMGTVLRQYRETAGLC